MAILNSFQQALTLEPSFYHSDQKYQTQVLNLLQNVKEITPELLAELLVTRGVWDQDAGVRARVRDYSNCVCDSCTVTHCPNND